MPYTIRKLPNQDLYRVYNTQTKEVHSYASTLENAKKQVKLLHMVDAGVPLKKEGGNFAEDGKNLKPIFSRVGSKFSLIKQVLEVIPPHTTYVEAFIGGGSIFWNKSPAKKSVINDLDKDLVDAYRNLKKAPLSQLQELDYLDKPESLKSKDYKNPVYKKSIADLVASLDTINSKSSPAKKLIKYFKITRGTYNQIGKGNIYFNIDFKPYIAKMEEYKRIIKNTTITNKDYIDVIKQYDSPTTFFLLDPPYEKSDGLYTNDTIDYNEMNEVLKKIKGKFLLTINDSKEIEDIFKDFNQKKVSVSNASNSPNLETKGRKELFISNYSMKQGGSIETDEFETKGLVSLPEFRSVKINLPTYMYKRLPDIKGKPPPYRYKLVIPITKSRNLSSRKQETSLSINQKPVSKPIINVAEVDDEDKPLIEEFSPADKEKIQQYYYNVKANEKKNPDEINKDYYAVIERGRPLPCENARPKKEKPVKVPKEKKVKPPPRPRGRPRMERQLVYVDNWGQGRYRRVRPQEESEASSVSSAPTAKTNAYKRASKYIKPRDAFEEEKSVDDLFATLYQDEEDKSESAKSSYFGSKPPSRASSKKSSKASSVGSDLSLPSFPSMSSYKSKKSSKAKSVSSESSISTAKSSKLSSLGSLEDFDPDAELEKVLGKSGKGIENNISNNNKMANSWITYVKEYAAKNGMSYRDALRDPKCKAGYKKGGAMIKRGMGVVDELGDQDLISIAYDDSELGANAGKKYISL